MPVPNESFVVKLDIRDSINNGPRWAEVEGSDKKKYSYKYTGGSHPAQDGHVEHKIGIGDATVTINLETDAYEIDDISFTGDHHGQLSTIGSGKYTQAITNKCSAQMEVHYKVKVRRTGTGTTIQCDPVIKNVPV